MKINKKASRNENLYVFSHEHHHGLVFAVRLKKASQTSTETLKKYVLHFWDSALDAHFKNEEELFLHLLANKDIKTQFLREHKLINSLVNDIQSANEDIIQKAEELSDQLKLHIKFEEKVLFPWLQDNLSPDELYQIGESLKSIEVKAHEFEPKFWE
ncbi:MAG: hypothetical protein DRJ07_06185 [Bacteroidetes bacterium]|nr:MAG: hypothetical protein DRJ07_06185 [Bacteroidota bacterium]